MPEFARIEYFEPMDMEGTKFNPRGDPITRQDITEINRTYGDFFPLYYDSISDVKQNINSRGQIPTGTYVIKNKYDWFKGLIFTTAKRDGRGANAIYYNEGVSILDNGRPDFSTLLMFYCVCGYRPPWKAFFVKDKLLKGLWVKRGQYLQMPSSIYIKQNGAIKKIIGIEIDPYSDDVFQ